MLQEAELSAEADSGNNLGGSSETMYFIGLDVHKRTISYCVKDAAGRVHQEGKIGSTRRELDCWMPTLPQPRMIATPCETRIEAERVWPRDANFPEIWMAQIEKEIRLLRHQHARHAKHRGISR